MDEEYQFAAIGMPNADHLPTANLIAMPTSAYLSTEQTAWREIEALHALFSRMGIPGHKVNGEPLLLAQRIEIMLERPVKWNTTKTITRKEKA